MRNQMSDEQFELLQNMLAPKAQHEARVEDAVLKVKTRYDRGLDLIMKIIWILEGRSYMEPEDYPKCPHCNENIFE